MIYIYIGMRNLDLLKTGSKPAPGELAIVQGLVNTVDIEDGTDEIGSVEQLKDWLTRFGLWSSKGTISENDLKTFLSFREALRQMLLANNGEAVKSAQLARLNQLISQYPLIVSFNADGAFSFSASNDGIGQVLGQILARIITAIAEGTWARLKACKDTKCQWAFYDSSKNHSGRWCSMSVCGSRDKARAYRKRQSKMA